ncbi:MAG: hypothetical protein SCK70_10570 [bacterium]|nr:hypothetical protein [bacterium]
MDVHQEAEQILRLTNNDRFKALEVLEKQMNVLHMRAQVLMSLAGIVLTITGFSGRLIAGTSTVAQILVISGLSTVLISAVWVFIKVMSIKWLTAEVCDESLNCFEAIITRRNKKTKAFVVGGRILCVGLFLYTIAFALMLLNASS